MRSIINTIIALCVSGLAMSFFLDTSSSDGTHTMVMFGVGLPVFLAVIILCDKLGPDKKKRP